MGVQNIYSRIIYKHNYAYENKYRHYLSVILKKKYKKTLIINQDEVRESINFSTEYFISKFSEACFKEKSLSFYQHVLFLHDQATDLVYQYQESAESSNIDFYYVSKYRRILKFILEQTCENRLISGEPTTPYLITRIQDKLDELMYLGEMILMCTEMFAEQDMIEDLGQISFDKDGFFVFSRKHHYNKAFDEVVIKSWGAYLTKEAFDSNAIEDFTSIIKKAFGIRYNDVSHMIASIHEQFKDNAGDYTGFNWDGLVTNFKTLFNVPETNSTIFFQGLTLNRENKKSLKEVASKPYLINKYLYRPILIWNVDDKDFAFITKQAWAESIIQLTTNAIPWGKAPEEWMKNSIINKYVHQKEDSHDVWLDDKVENILKRNDLIYARNIVNINDKNIIKNPGEIDFLIISEKLQKVFVVDCKHLLGRYDIQNQKLDYLNFVKGTKNKSYNSQLIRKKEWILQNLDEVQSHFKVNLRGFEIEGCFIINTPTFYMFNSDLRLFTIDQFDEVLNNYHKDIEFYFETTKKKYKVHYPYFRLPEFYEKK